MIPTNDPGQEPEVKKERSVIVPYFIGLFFGGLCMWLWLNRSDIMNKDVKPGQIWEYEPLHIKYKVNEVKDEYVAYTNMGSGQLERETVGYFKIDAHMIWPGDDSAKEASTKPATIVIYDTIAHAGTTLRHQYHLPENYRLEYDSARKGWLAIWHWDDGIGDGFLSQEISGFITLYRTKPYAEVFPSPKAAVKAIKKHWAAVLADRAIHSNEKQ